MNSGLTRFLRLADEDFVELSLMATAAESELVVVRAVWATDIGEINKAEVRALLVGVVGVVGVVGGGGMKGFDGTIGSAVASPYFQSCDPTEMGGAIAYAEGTTPR